MHVHVLGSGAGGGFPQWNCNCRNCRGMRAGTLRARARTQSSIAVSADRSGWVLLNASPDIRAQLDAFPELQPGGAVRNTAIRAVLLMDSQIDHVTGLLSLREGRRLAVHCTAQVRADLTTGLPLIPVLSHYLELDLQTIELDQPAGFAVPGVEHLSFQAIALTSKAPPYSPHRHAPERGDNLGMLIRDTRSGSTLFYAPGLGEVDARVRSLLAEADCALIDGTFWRDDEMAVEGISSKRASEMGHLALSGAGGMLSMLKALPPRRRILIHINNTNPILDEDSAERSELTACGVEVAWDGMEISL
jgi:pyrroloquinoline quinone biosynthesis protein B